MQYTDTEVVYLLVFLLILIISATFYYINLVSKKKVSIKVGFIAWIKKVIAIIFAGW
jgi:hypothetical protein